jgi:Cu/Ag efflux protein CusF
MEQMVTAVLLSLGLIAQTGGSALPFRLAQTTGGGTPGSTEPMPARAVAERLTVRGTISAIDRDNGTVTLKGPRGGTLTLEVRDTAKLDAIKVGDPVIATYVEAVGFQARKAGSTAPGSASPGVTTQTGRVTSKPGETPAGAIGREITVTATITAIDRKAQTVTIKGPSGDSETIKATDPKNLDAVKVGDLVDITYTQALTISLDKSPS